MILLPLKSRPSKDKIYRHMKHLKLFEEYSEEHYNRVLDLYNEKGLKGMTPEEVAYLKSGGKSELPTRFKSEIAQEEYDNFVKGQGTNELKTPDWQDIYVLQSIIDNSTSKVYSVNNFDGVGFYLDALCSLVFEIDKKTIEELEKLNHYRSDFLEIKNGKYYYAIPKSYLEHLELD